MEIIKYPSESPESKRRKDIASTVISVVYTIFMSIVVWLGCGGRIMGITKADYERATTQIVTVLVLNGRSKDMERLELIRFIYNEAVDDAANFIDDLAPYNPSRMVTLRAAAKEIREKLTLREVDL